LHQLLKQQVSGQRSELSELLEEQKRTNKLLRGLLYVGMGFLLGALAVLLLPAQ
jgi:ubiquinone biosynthesis protein